MILGLKRNETIEEIELLGKEGLFSIVIDDPLEGVEYAYKVFKKSPCFFDGTWLQDPWAKFAEKKHLPWGSFRNSPWSLCYEPSPFDWEGIKKPNHPIEKTIVYEMHLRGFTKDDSSSTLFPGTYLALIEKIPYLKRLGITAIELMPIFLFNEKSLPNIDPTTNQQLMQYWGYSPLSFFIPMPGYAIQNPVHELKTMVKELHKAGIEVILDVVYNHTGEGNCHQPPFSFRGIDASMYYLLDDEGKDLDYTGCKNTVHCNHPDVINLIIESLCYWTTEFQIDGFRFDLAAIFTRGSDGKPLENPPLLEKIAQEKRLETTKFFAEAWDAAGLYLVQEFSKFGTYSIWNDKFRDHVRLFLRGNHHMMGAFADALTASFSLFSPFSSSQSLNFITAHDGFTLNDLVSYEKKDNFRNGENNEDGNFHNISSNSGVEGKTKDPWVLEKREKKQRNFLLTLFLSKGVPMLLMGDEYGHSRSGNNNAYVHDDLHNWFLWDLLEKNQKRFLFVQGLISFRKKLPFLQNSSFFTPEELKWYNHACKPLDWSQKEPFFAAYYQGPPILYWMCNLTEETKEFILPQGIWKKIVDTAKDWDEHHFWLDSSEIVTEKSFFLEKDSMVLLYGLG